MKKPFTFPRLKEEYDRLRAQLIEDNNTRLLKTLDYGWNLVQTLNRSAPKPKHSPPAPSVP